MKLLSFLILGLTFFSKEPSFIYHEFSSEEDLTTKWYIEKLSNDHLEINGEDENSITILDCNDSFQINKFHFRSKKDKTNYIISSSNHHELKIEEILENGVKEKKLSIDYPWIQQFGFGLNSFVKSEQSSLKFTIVKPDDFTIQDMIAKKGKIEPLTIDGKTYEAQKVSVTLQGFKSMFWKAELWYDAKNADFLKYKANKGPNTSITTILLKKRN